MCSDQSSPVPLAFRVAGDVPPAGIERHARSSRRVEHAARASSGFCRCLAARLRTLCAIGRGYAIAGQLIFCAGLVVATLQPLNAQVERATLAGTVTDNSGAVIPGVAIRVINEATSTPVNIETDAAGEYRAVNLTPGRYTVEAEKRGFQRFVTKGLVLQVAQEGRLDVQLQVGGVEQTVEVTGAAALLQTEGSTVGQVIDTKPIETLPLNGRNIVQLAVLAPGVTGLSYAQTGTINSGLRPDELRPGGTTLLANGARDSSNQLLLDGIDNTEMISQTFVVRPPVEGVQEFKAITNNAGAEYGRAGGAVLVTNTKSGGNSFHGSAFEYLRNSAVDAKNFFAPTCRSRSIS